MKRFRNIIHNLVLALLVTVGVQISATAVPVYAAADVPLVSTNPVDYTPDVLGTWKSGTDFKTVNEYARVGNSMYAGGVVNTVRLANSSIKYSFWNVFRFDATSGLFDKTFAPVLLGKDGTRETGEVFALEPTPDGQYLYIGGKFTSTNGAATTGIVKWNLQTNTRELTFSPQLIRGASTSATVYDIKFVNNRLFVASDATKINGVATSPLMSLDPTTGARTSYISASVTEPVIDPSLAVNNPNTGKPYTSGALRVEKISVNPQGTQAVFIGNFRKVDGTTRLQVAMLTLGATNSALSTWYPGTVMTNTTVQPSGLAYPGTTPCDPKFSACLRDVDWDPSGSWFALCGTGAGGSTVTYPSLRDSISRWQSTNEPNALPLWVNYTGGDTFLSCRATTNTVYGGGHFRYLNSSVYLGGVKQTSTTYARQTHYGIGAINASTGAAISTFNAGTTTGRGYGWAGMFISPASSGPGAGLWVGGDADGIMGEPRLRIGLFPL